MKMEQPNGNVAAAAGGGGEQGDNENSSLSLAAAAAAAATVATVTEAAATTTTTAAAAAAAAVTAAAAAAAATDLDTGKDANTSSTTSQRGQVPPVQEISEDMLFRPSGGIQRPALYQFISFVAPAAKLPPNKKKWATRDASAFYCHKCHQTYYKTKGTSAQLIRHMQRFHKRELHELEGTDPYMDDNDDVVVDYNENGDDDDDDNANDGGGKGGKKKKSKRSKSDTTTTATATALATATAPDTDVNMLDIESNDKDGPKRNPPFPRNKRVKRTQPCTQRERLQLVSALADWACMSLLSSTSSSSSQRGPRSIFDMIQDPYLTKAFQVAQEIEGKIITMPTGKAISNMIHEHALTLQGSLRRFLKEHCSYYSITANLWRTMVNNNNNNSAGVATTASNSTKLKTYVSIGIHFLSKDFQRFSATLRVLPLLKKRSGNTTTATMTGTGSGSIKTSKYQIPSTADVISQMILETLHLYGLSKERMTVYITDTGAVVPPSTPSSSSSTTKSLSNSTTSAVTNQAIVAARASAAAAVAAAVAATEAAEAAAKGGTSTPSPSTIAMIQQTKHFTCITHKLNMTVHSFLHGLSSSSSSSKKNVLERIETRFDLEKQVHVAHDGRYMIMDDDDNDDEKNYDENANNNNNNNKKKKKKKEKEKHLIDHPPEIIVQKVIIAIRTYSNYFLNESEYALQYIKDHQTYENDNTNNNKNNNDENDDDDDIVNTTNHRKRKNRVARVPLVPIVDDPGQWKSTYAMMKRAIRLRSHFDSYYSYLAEMEEEAAAAAAVAATTPARGNKGDHDHDNDDDDDDERLVQEAYWNDIYQRRQGPTPPKQLSKDYWYFAVGISVLLQGFDDVTSIVANETNLSSWSLTLPLLRTLRLNLEEINLNRHHDLIVFSDMTQFYPRGLSTLQQLQKQLIDIYHKCCLNTTRARTTTTSSSSTNDGGNHGDPTALETALLWTVPLDPRVMIMSTASSSSSSAADSSSGGTSSSIAHQYTEEEKTIAKEMLRAEAIKTATEFTREQLSKGRTSSSLGGLTAGGKKRKKRGRKKMKDEKRKRSDFMALFLSRKTQTNKDDDGYDYNNDDSYYDDDEEHNTNNDGSDHPSADGLAAAPSSYTEQEVDDELERYFRLHDKTSQDKDTKDDNDDDGDEDDDDNEENGKKDKDDGENDNDTVNIECPLTWWRTSKKRYDFPILQLLARRWLSAVSMTTTITSTSSSTSVNHVNVLFPSMCSALSGTTTPATMMTILGTSKSTTPPGGGGGGGGGSRRRSGAGGGDDNVDDINNNNMFLTGDDGNDERIQDAVFVRDNIFLRKAKVYKTL